MERTYIDLLNANSLIQKIDFKGKEYGEVSERIKAFRYLYPEGGIETEIIKYENGEVVIKATITNENGKILGTGTAQEKEGSSFINKTSFIENCETSAWGRALGCLGIGINDSIASAEEMQMAISKQEEIAQDELIGGAFVLKGGKYNGKTIQEVLEKDEAYIRWCIENGQNLTVKLNMQKALVDNGKLDEVEL
jgi:hypothetical protein